MTDESDSILVVTQYFPPETGASQTRWDELSKRWSEEASVTVLTSAPDYPEGEIYDGYDNQWLRHEKRDGVDVFYTKTITSPSGNLLRRSLKFVWFMLISMVVGLRHVSPSVVIATSPQPLTGISAWVIARVKRATFVFEVRDLWPESILAVSDFDNKLVIWLLERTVTFLYQRSDHLIVVSKAFIEPIVDCGVDRSKIAFHPNGIDLAFYDVEGDGSPVLNDLDDEFTISYVGTIGLAHGLSIVLEAAPGLDDVQFVIVGDGAERDVLEAQAADLDNVTFTGRRPKEEVPYILRESDVALVHLKPRDIFETVIPSKLLESMAAGLPVILGVRGEAKRILMDADAGIAIEPDNNEELVSAIRRLRDDPEEWKAFAASGREYVNAYFDWDSISGEYLETITERGDRFDE
ncbi:Glycosyltransferase involved in cell wall bisynthesis [Halorubrum xinjiangense]|uniref:Glycosyltransferase involved in cell wall bisynthesis n=1 Tax=Halorubrum xinjiangense TaxID=261291 RepID=A0A1G7HWT1_9EURY|nr:glycosyltransferase family 4 protein [Halorubrum xinjiangense]SDF04798.1 Glycosyltransferase involved in cell wall bisynthesis [Halorubrum xinjiangense]